LEFNSNRLVSGKSISIPAAASLEFLVGVTETILARGDAGAKFTKPAVLTLMRGKCTTRIGLDRDRGRDQSFGARLKGRLWRRS
jgi:hypothetical protein